MGLWTPSCSPTPCHPRISNILRLGNQRKCRCRVWGCAFLQPVRMLKSPPPCTPRVTLTGGAGQPHPPWQPSQTSTLFWKLLGPSVRASASSLRSCSKRVLACGRLTEPLPEPAAPRTPPTPAPTPSLPDSEIDARVGVGGSEAEAGGREWPAGATAPGLAPTQPRAAG